MSRQTGKALAKRQGANASDQADEFFHAWNPVHRDDLPKYESLVEAIADGIESGALKAGTRLPPQRELARHFNVTVATVTKSIDLATRRGLVVTRSGSGTFISGTPGGNETADSHPQGFFDLSLNSPPVSVVAPVLQRSFTAMAASADIHKLFGYAPIPGTLKNRRAGAAWFALRDLDVLPDQILITQGAHEGLICALLALTEPGDAVLCERLNYAGLIRIAQLLRIRLIGIDVDDEGLDTDQLAQYGGDASIKAIVCTPIVHNPTTATMSAARRAGLVRFAKAASIPIVEDDIYGLLAGSEVAPLAQAWPSGTIVVSSLSKSVSPGIRLGYVAAPASLVSQVRDAILMLGWTEPAMQTAVASHLIHSGDAFRCALLHRDEARKRIALAAKVLGPAMLTSRDAASYHAWVSTGQLQPADVAAELYRTGVLVSPATHFSVDGDGRDMAIRISLGGSASCEELHAPLESLARILSGGQTGSFGAIV